VDELTKLATEASQGQQGALTALVRATQNDVWRLCAHLVDPQSADDLTQETYLRVFAQLKRFRGEGAVRNWMLTIARRTCAAEISGRQRRRDASLQLASRLPRAEPDQTLRIELNMLLDGLDLDRRTAFVLTQVMGCSYEEAAQICDCPVGTIRSRVARARDDLIGLSGRNVRAGQRAGLPHQALGGERKAAMGPPISC
jgi:RNA polymerase sigma-70 factor (ECF subfamily)